MSAVDNTKPPVVLIHGMWSTGETLSELQQAFERQGYVVHAPTLPYHKEKSAYDTDDRARLARASLQEYVDFIVAKVNALETAPILVGHSMGGLLAQLVAARVQVDKLVLLSSAAPGGINSWSWSMVRTFGRNLFRFPLWTRVTEVRESNIRYGIANTQTPVVQRQIFDMSTYESGMATFQIGVGGFLPHGFSRVDAQAVQSPVLVIGGTVDRITPIKIQRAIANKYGARAQLVELPGVCHWTVGGSNFPRVCSTMFHWLENKTA